MPEPIRLRVGSVTPQQFSVYEEFGRNLPGFKSSVDERSAAAVAAAAAQAAAQAAAAVQQQQQQPGLVSMPPSQPVVAPQPPQQQPNFNQLAEEMNVHYDTLIGLLRNEVNIMPSGHFLTLNLQNLMIAVHDFRVSIIMLSL